MMLNRSSMLRRVHRSLRALAGACLLAFLFAVSLTCAHAEVRVQGDIAAVRVDANQAQISEVISALGPAFNLRYRTSIPLNKTISGTYMGSLGSVLARLLDGFNYVIKTEQDKIEVLIIGMRGDRAVPTAQPPAPASKSLASQWRSSTPAQK
jgi:hypothetical protein